MRLIQKLVFLLRAVFRRGELERQMETELAEHIESETADLMARGLSRAEAHKRAIATMGRVDAIKEECRDSRGVSGWEHWKQDISFGVRLLSRNRTFSCLALAMIALGIGSTTAVFSLIDGILIRPLPYPDPDRLFHVRYVDMRGPFAVLRANSQRADYAGHLGVRAFNATRREFPERLKGSEVSANFFRVLQSSPVLGRAFGEGDDRPGGQPVAILAHEFWMQRYAGRADVIGEQISLDEKSYEIIGVMPAGFRYPAPEANFWIPMRLDPRMLGEYWGSSGIYAFARLRTGATPASAESELRTWIPRIRAMFPWRMPDAWGRDTALVPLHDQLVAGAKTKNLLLLGVVTLVLLIAVINVANLLIGQAAARERELALRASLGATPDRLTKQLLTEATVLAMAGGMLGAILAVGQLTLLKHLLPADTPRLAEVVLNQRILAFSAAISIGSGFLFGLLPAWRVRTRQILTSSDGRSTLSPRSARTDALLVATEAAFATVLLVGAGLLLRTLWTMQEVNPGFRVESVVTAEVSLNRTTAASRERITSFSEQLRRKLGAYPGVTGVAAMNVLPLTPEMSVFTAAIEDHPRPPQEPQFVLWSTYVTPEHLETLGIRLLQGRGFTVTDRQGSEPVALISAATARRFWPKENPVGRHLRPVGLQEWRTVVGVVGDVRNYSISGPPAWVDGEVYLPLAQLFSLPRALSLVARVSGNSSTFEKQLPQMVNQLCGTCPVSKIARMESVVAAAVQAPRSTASLIGGFALLALMLAAAGIYGVVSHGVLRRTRELGLRLALGASRRRVAWLVIGSSLRYTFVGSMVGLAASWVLARWIKTLLYGVGEHDLASFSIAPVLLLTVAMIAVARPVLRALRIDPAESLREG